MKVYFLIFIVLLNFCSYAQKKKNNKNSIHSQSIEDFQILSQTQYPYIEKFHDALGFKLSNNLNESKKLFLECLKENPKDDAVLFALAEIAKAQNDKTTALNYFLQAQSNSPENLHYTLEIANIFLDKADFENAVKYFTILCDKEPRNIELKYAFGQALLYNREYEKAIATFNSIEEITGPIHELTMLKIDMYQIINKSELIENDLLALKNAYPDDLEVLKSVIAYYEELNQQDKSLMMIKELVQKDSTNALGNFVLAQNSIKNNDTVTYFKTIVPALESSEIPISDKLFLVNYLIDLPHSYDVQKNELGELLVKVGGNESKVFAMQAEIFISMKRTRDAIQSYRKALGVNESDYRLWTSVLAIESAYKNFNELYVDAQEAIELFPTLPFVYFKAAEASIALQKFDEAKEFLDAGINFIVEDDGQKARYSMSYGQILMHKGEYKKGIIEFEKALLLDPNSILIRCTYALYTLKYLKDTKLARELIIQFDIPAQNYALFYEAMYQILILEKDYNKCTKMLKNGLNQIDFKAEIYDLLGNTYHFSGDNENAIINWEKAIMNESRNVEIEYKILNNKFIEPRYF